MLTDDPLDNATEGKHASHYNDEVFLQYAASVRKHLHQVIEEREELERRLARTNRELTEAIHYCYSGASGFVPPDVVDKLLRVHNTLITPLTE